MVGLYVSFDAGTKIKLFFTIKLVIREDLETDNATVKAVDNCADAYYSEPGLQNQLAFYVRDNLAINNGGI